VQALQPVHAPRADEHRGAERHPAERESHGIS
jgi:hypothetical protein